MPCLSTSKVSCDLREYVLQDFIHKKFVGLVFLSPLLSLILLLLDDIKFILEFGDLLLLVLRLHSLFVSLDLLLVGSPLQVPDKVLDGFDICHEVSLPRPETFLLIDNELLELFGLLLLVED